MVLVPLADVSITGRVLPSADGVSLAGATLRVMYDADWLCGFFGLPDCMTPTMEIAVGRIREDGSFSIKVPNFTRDPIIARSSSIGGFRLRADRTEAPFHYGLQPQGTESSTIAVAAAYRDLVLVPRRD